MSHGSWDSEMAFLSCPVQPSVSSLLLYGLLFFGSIFYSFQHHSQDFQDFPPFSLILSYFISRH